MFIVERVYVYRDGANLECELRLFTFKTSFRPRELISVA